MSVAQWVEALERDCMQRDGVKLPEARVTIARRLGIAPGTLENIARGRKKSVAGWIEQKIKDAFSNALQSEIRRLEAELELVRARDGGIRDDALASADAALARARELVNEAKGM